MQHQRLQLPAESCRYRPPPSACQPGLAFRTAADDSRGICLAMATPAAMSIPVYIPLTYVYARLRPVATEDAKVAIFADFQRDCGRRGIYRVQPSGGDGGIRTLDTPLGRITV
jgi:hypothetical protein